MLKRPQDVNGLKSALQAVVDKHAAFWNVSISIGVHNASFELAVAAGIDDYATGTPFTTEHRIPQGSVTKMYTTIATLRLAEKGIISLDQRVAPLIDKYLAVPLPCAERPSFCTVACADVTPCLASPGAAPCTKVANTTASTCARCFRYLHCDASGPVKVATLASMWGWDGKPNTSRISDVTFRQLIGMTSGVSDYYMDSNDWLYHQVEGSTRDIEPLEYLMHQDHSIPFVPGAPGRGFYSTNGFSLVGLALATVLNVTDWAQLDQRDLAWGDQLPSDDRSLFPGRGTCLTYPMVAKQYASLPPHQLPFVEISNHSCLNSWTGGNIAARPLDVARLVYAAYSEQRTLISAKSYEEVTSLHCLSDGFFGGFIAYGLGVIGICNGGHPKMMQACGYDIIGHGGLDYGSGSNINGYLPSLKVGVSIAMTSAYAAGSGLCGKNCSLAYKHQTKASDIVTSEALAVIAAAAGQTPTECGATTYDVPPAKECVDAPSFGTFDGKSYTCAEHLAVLSREWEESIGDLCDNWLSRRSLASLETFYREKYHVEYTPPPGYALSTLAIDLCRGTAMAHNSGPCWLRANQKPWC